MKFSADAKNLLSGINRVFPVVPSKSTVPVLEHILFSVADNKCKLTASNQNISIKTTVEITSIDDGETLLPAKRLYDLLKMVTGEVKIDIGENMDARLTAGRGSYKMKSLPANEYIDIPDIDYNYENEKSYDFENFADIAQKTIVSVSNDEFRPSMTGVLFDFNDKVLNAVSTDGYSLMKVFRQTEYEGQAKFIIPADTMNTVMKIAENVKIYPLYDKNEIYKLLFVSEDTTILSKIITENFPPYESVIPDSHDKSAVVDKSQLKAILKRVILFADQESKVVKMKFNQGELQVSAQDADGGRAGNEYLNAEYDGEETEIGMNYKYLERALAVLPGDDTVEISFENSSKPVLLSTDNETLALLMPVRLD